MNLPKNTKIIIIFVLSLVVLFCFSKAKDNQFTNWDDDYYVTNDPYIKALTPHNLKVIFTEDITKNNYHPLCMLSLAINYYFAQLNPSSYYMTNVAIHLLNTILVFLLFFNLSSFLKIDEKGKYFIAGIGALWFGIHPMHVESVCWIAERKDVLYAFFYIIGLITYVKYTTTREMKWFWTTFVVFIASCLSKPMAVVFPASLLCMDIILDRGLFNLNDKGLSLLQRINGKLISEKFIFFLFSLIIGGAAFYTQSRTGAVASFNVLTIQERFMFASYSFIMYVSKAFNPTYLSTFYPYPYKYVSGYYHQIYYLAPFIALAILILPVIWAYKKGGEYLKVVVFGLYFFLANVIFVLQFISVGAAIMSDRYSYVAYIGLFFLLPWVLYKIIQKIPSYKVAVYIVVGVFSLFLAKLCYDRTDVWHNAETLLTDGVTKYPFKKDHDLPHDEKNSGIALLSYKWLGNYYYHKGAFDKAMECFEILIKLHATDPFVENKVSQIINMRNGGSMPITENGVVENNLSEMNNSAPQQNGEFQKYLDSSYYYAHTGDSLRALRAYINAFRYNQGVERLFADSSFKAVQIGHFKEAYIQYTIVMKINTSNPFYYFYRGVALFSMSKMKEAMIDWEQALQIKTKEPVRDVIQSASYNLSVAYDSVGKDSLAVYYLEMAKSNGYTVSPEFETKLRNKKTAELKKHKK